LIDHTWLISVSGQVSASILPSTKVWRLTSGKRSSARSYAMASTRDKVKNAIDKTAAKTKGAVDKGSQMTKNAARKVGQTVKNAGQKIKDQGN
jgi:hypothetical protein